jgi:hypothetical protein
VANGCGYFETLWQGAPVSKTPPLVRVPKAQVERRRILEGSGVCFSRKFLKLESLKCHFLDFGVRFSEMKIF